MSILATALSWFGNSKTAGDVFDKDSGILVKAGGFINDLHLSDAEKLEYDNSMANSVRNFAVSTLDENTERSKTRRDLAVKWFALHIHLIELSVLGFMLDTLAGLLDAELALFDTLWKIVTYPQLWAITGGIGLFFWGSHTLRSSKWSKEK